MKQCACSYYKQYRVVHLKADEATAQRLTEYLLEEREATPENALRVLRWLEDHADAGGTVLETSDCWYGWLLWDVRDRHPRK